MDIREKRLGYGLFKGLDNKSPFVIVFVMVLAIALLAGCHYEDDEFDGPQPVFETRILSDPVADGDIAFTAPATFTISSALAAGNVQAGIDPASGVEFRAFLNFPLRGWHGVPSGAVIESATLEIFINSITISAPGDTVPLLIDLVSFQPPTIIADDFNRSTQPPLLTLPFEFFPSDAGSFVVIDVTALMDEAQLEGLPDLQLRLLLDFSVSTGLVEIDDDATATAPLLTVTYF